MVQEVIHLRKFLGNLGFPQTAPTLVFADNETCIAWSEGSVVGSERAKHVDLRLHEARTAGHLQLHKIDSKLNAADILTKASTPTDIYEDLRRRTMDFKRFLSACCHLRRCRSCWEPSFYRLGGAMKISDVIAAAESGWSRAGDSD